MPLKEQEGDPVSYPYRTGQFPLLKDNGPMVPLKDSFESYPKEQRDWPFMVSLIDSRPSLSP